VVSLLLLSHSPKIAEGIKDLAMQMAEEACVIAVGGTKAGTLGADYDSTFTAMKDAAKKGDVIVLCDLGSARMTGQMAKDALDPALQNHVFLSNAAIVEGSLIVAIAIAAGENADGILRQLDEYLLPKDE
jgi:dihydroxyacetone kinase phosphotransfer subunit